MSAAAFLRIKKLTGAAIVKTAARHNRRAIAAETGAAGHIDPSRCHLNVTMEGPDTPHGVAELAQSLMQAAGVGKLRKDAVRAVETVFSLPAGLPAVDPAAYFGACVEWARATFGPVLSADAHHDEAAPHVHVLACRWSMAAWWAATWWAARPSCEPCRPTFTPRWRRRSG